MPAEQNEDKIPSYISKEFFKKALENGFKTKNVQIENYTISSVGGGGENYTSDIYRVVVKFRVPGDIKTREIGLILKDIQTEGKARELLNKLDIFSTEENMYFEIVPKIEEIVGNNSMMAPKCFYTSKPESVMVLRDLKEMGYHLGDRLKGLDEAHCAVVLKKIGQFHAASMVIAKENPESIKHFSKGIFSEHSKDSEIFKGLFVANFEHMISIMETWPDYETIVFKLKKMLPDFVERGIDLMKPQKGELRVLNHGDLWVNNFMFKYDDNNAPCDVAFVDLQLSVYASPGIDINYFLNISAQLDVLKMKRYELLKVYYHSLKSTLKKLNFSPIPQWDDIRKEIRAKEFYGLVALSGVLPVITMDRSASQDNSIETFRDVDASKRKREIMFSSERIIKTMQYAINRLDELGVLDSK